LVLVDVDHFKTINDVHGHANGDLVLREVALRLAGFIRTTDFPARVGGEEFAVILHEPLPTSMREVAERVRRAVGSAPVRVGERFVQVTVSIGVAVWPAKDVSDRASLYEAADKALYAAKQAGRDRVVIAGQPLQAAA
jgi:diguanylate cyclase (GGDEF)-like protein